MTAMRGTEVRLVTGMIPGSTGLSTPRSARSATRPVYSDASKKNWVTAKSARGQLGGQVVAVAGRIGRERMAAGLGRDPDREPPDGGGQLHQLGGVG